MILTADAAHTALSLADAVQAHDLAKPNPKLKLKDAQGKEEPSAVAGELGVYGERWTMTHEVVESTAAAADNCTDYPADWHDSDGPRYNCDWYAKGNRCEVDGDFFENNGYTANQAFSRFSRQAPQFIRWLEAGLEA